MPASRRSNSTRRVAQGRKSHNFTSLPVHNHTNWRSYMANLAGLQNALNVSSGGGSAAGAESPDAPPPRKEPRGPKPASKTPVPIGRAGRENIAAWLPGDF